MPSKIILKKSSVAAKAPVAGDLDFGELAINYTDSKLYFKKADGSIDAFSSAAAAAPVTSVGGNIGAITDAQLLASIKNVDGTGSGLDADFLDGNSAAAFYLASNPSGYTSNTGTVTSVGATAPIVSSGGTAPSLSIAAANSTTNGYMTSAYAAKLDGIAAGATNVTNTNQLTNGAGYITSSGSITGNAATATNSSQLNGLSKTQLWNNSGQSHSTYQSFSAIPDFGVWFMQNSAATDTPQTGSQFYIQTEGLGNDYTYGSYALMTAVARDHALKYTYYRTREGGAWGAWSKSAAGYADGAGTVTSRTITIGNTGKAVDHSANVSWTLAEIGAYAATNPSGYTSNIGTVTGVTATAPVASSGGTAPVISMAAASSGVNGYMTGAYATKLDGIAAGATNVTNTNQLTNGAGYITSSGSISGNAATATYATSAGSAPANGGTATALNSSNYISQKGSTGSWNADFQNTPAGTTAYNGDVGANTTNNPGNSWWIQQNFRHTNSSNYWGTQVAWGWEDNANRLATRNVTGGVFGSWIYYLNSGNYNSYSPTLTGGNASGTWGINITGSAATATDSTKVLKTGDTMSGPLNITGNGSYVGDSGYSTLILQDTSGYPGVNWRSGSSNWLYRMNAGGSTMSWLYSSNASSQAVGGFTEYLNLSTALLSHPSSMRSPIFYDSADTAFYADPNNVSRMLQINFNNLYYAADNSYGFLGASVYADTINSGYASDPLELNYVRGTWAGISHDSLRAPLFYDHNDTAYYGDFAASSVFQDTQHRLITFKGVGGDSGNGSAPTTYGIYQQGGAWSHPYPDLCIGYHTGIKIGAYYGYNGTRFYNNSDWATQIFSVGDGDNHVRVSEIGYAGSSFRAPIFYDSDDTAYYTTPNGTSSMNRISTVRADNWLYLDNNYGHSVVGVYSSTQLQGVFSMGDSYKLAADGSTAGGLYGLAWSHPNAGAKGGANNLNDHGLLIINNGSFRAALSSRAVFSDDVRGTLFYDYNNTGYYCDPNSTSNLVGLTVANTITGSVSGNAGTITSQANSATITASTAANGSQIVLRDGNGDDYRRYGFADYFNMSHGVSGTTTDSIFYSSGDNYIRKNNATGFRASLNVPTRTGGDATGNWGIQSSTVKSWDGYGHNGTGMAAFYNWGGTNAGSGAPSGSTYTNGIDVGSNPGDPSYGFQIASNMWNVGLWTRSYDSNVFGGWVRLLDSSNYSSYALPLSGGTLTGNLGIGLTPSLNWSSLWYANQLGIGSISTFNSATFPGIRMAVNAAGTGVSASQVLNAKYIEAKRAASFQIVAGNGTFYWGTAPVGVVDASIAWTYPMILDTSGYLIVGYSGSQGAYRLQVNGQIFATSSTIATSDARYKENVETLTDGLKIIKALRPVMFNWKKHAIHEFNTKTPTVGFLAQEFQQVLIDKPYLNSIVKSSICTLEPEVLNDDGDVIKEAVTEEFLGIAEGNIIAILTSAMQEQQSIIESQEERIVRLESLILNLTGK